MIRVWHVGGPDVSMRIPLLNALSERGFEVGAVGSGDGRSFLTESIPFERYQLNRWVGPLADLRSQRQLEEIFRRGAPDVVHAFDTKPGLLVGRPARRAGVSAVVKTVTGLGFAYSSRSVEARLLQSVYRVAQRVAGRHVDMTVFQNSDDRNLFLRYQLVPRGRDALVASSGLDVRKFTADRPIEGEIRRAKGELGIEGKTVVLMVARMVLHKGVIEFLEAARSLHRSRPDVKFMLVGPLQSEGRQAVSRSHIDAFRDAVDYLGERDDVRLLLELADLFVLPSYYREGVPRVLLEAGSLGIPLVAADVPGSREVVKDNWNGVLVQPRSAPALAAAISELLERREDWGRMGANGRRLVADRFDLAIVADAYARIYAGVLEGRLPAP